MPVSLSHGHCHMNLAELAWQLNARRSKGERRQNIGLFPKRGLIIKSEGFFGHYSAVSITKKVDILLLSRDPF